MCKKPQIKEVSCFRDAKIPAWKGFLPFRVAKVGVFPSSSGKRMIPLRIWVVPLPKISPHVTTALDIYSQWPFDQGRGIRTFCTYSPLQKEKHSISIFTILPTSPPTSSTQTPASHPSPSTHHNFAGKGTVSNTGKSASPHHLISSKTSNVPGQLATAKLWHRSIRTGGFSRLTTRRSDKASSQKWQCCEALAEAK